MKRLKYELLFVILFMTVGIAAVSSNLLINGSTPISSNADDFSVYFSDVLVDGEQDLSLIRNDTNLYFDFEFDTLGETKVITYDVTNASKNYDADVSISCSKGTIYLNISNSFDSDDYLSARSTRTGVLTITLVMSRVSDELYDNISCTISASAVERTSQDSANVPDIPVRTFKTGKEIIIADGKFNVISDNGDTVTLLAQQNLSDTTYKQTENQIWSIFAEDNGWEYTPGPKEIDVQSWGYDVRSLLNNYISFLKSEYDIDATGNLITLNELKELGCDIPLDYALGIGVGDWKCNDSQYIDWLDNNQVWWTRSATSDHSSYVWRVSDDGKLDYADSLFNSGGVRPVITISKDYIDAIIIDFTIDGITYYAEEGMYWSEWVASEYNTAGYVIFQDDLNFQVRLPSSLLSVNDSPFADTIIRRNEEYVSEFFF